MRTCDIRGGRALTQADLKRYGSLPQGVLSAAAGIVDDVRARGDAAVRECSEKFDGFAPASFRVADDLLEAAVTQVDEAFLSALRQAHRQIREFHERQRENSWFETRPDGTILGVKVTPLSSVAIYVPGGRAQYPSTVLMDAIPAKVAGVERVVMVTPPQPDGSLSAYTLAAAAVAGVDEVYAVGGAQAVAAVAYGTESIPAVDKVVGPGNAYVAAAKRLVSGDVGIDMIAGPSEVCVLADETADPVVVAADLMAQAEHDPMAACYLVTPSADLPARVLDAVAALAPQSPREKITRESLDENGVIIVTDDLSSAVDAVNVIAPEHLELHCEDAMALLGKVRNAGAIFVGEWSSEPLGDYVAGPDHTLPTGGTARFSNPLGVYDFQKHSSVIAYTREGLLADADAAQTLAQAEGLWAHALSVGLRVTLARGGLTGFADPGAACVDATRTAWPRPLDEPGRILVDGGGEG